MNRRDFLFSAAAGVSTAALSRLAFAGDSSIVNARLTLESNPPGAVIDREFIGLSYESAQLSHPEFFSATNRELVGFLRGLAPRGVLRIGGNTSEYAFWTPQPSPQSAEASGGIVGPDKGHKPAPPTQTTPQAIRNLREFLDATGWRAYYGLNLGKGTPEQAAEEAAYVFDTLGDRLILFQIGNEADLYGHNGLRPSGYDYSAFARDWQRFYDAVHARVPSAKFGGPDTSGTGTWVKEFAKQFHGQVEMLSSHYYAEGPASNPAMNLDHLLEPTNARWDNGIPEIRQAMADSHLPFRLSETNSCYGGGKQGVSNTFGSALWAADLMLELAAYGANGINFHGGGYGWYTPIAGIIPNGFVARPEYYGLLLFAQLLGGRMQLQGGKKITMDMESPNGLLKAYAALGADGLQKAILLNKDAKKRYRLHLQAPVTAEFVTIQRLIAPRLDDTTDITFNAAPVGDSGAWHSERFESVPVRNGSAVCEVPAGSAALLTWE